MGDSLQLFHSSIDDSEPVRRLSVSQWMKEGKRRVHAPTIAGKGIITVGLILYWKIKIMLYTFTGSASLKHTTSNEPIELWLFHMLQ